MSDPTKERFIPTPLHTPLTEEDALLGQYLIDRMIEDLVKVRDRIKPGGSRLVATSDLALDRRARQVSTALLLGAEQLQRAAEVNR